MVFSSLIFLFRFIPLFLIAYFVTPRKFRNYTLLAGSLVFYAYGEPLYILLMLLSIAVNHIFSLCIYNSRGSGRGYLVVALIYNFGMLFVFKYLGFVISIINGVAGQSLIPDPGIALPLGISFYTFQMASYVIDVYRGKYLVSRNPICFATYVSMFPQLIAGPIVNYGEIEEELSERKVKFAEIEWGVVLFVMGLAYKVLLANNIQSLWNDVQQAGVYGINTQTAWLGSVGFSMQIYFDFFGYSLMAIGLGHILGFKFPMNFQNPYVSRSATEFWRRWHITLGRWFREYVYIPLGGSRNGKTRMILATFAVWAFTGLWHGANWNFIIWGMFFFVILMIEKAGLKKILEKIPVIGHIYMIVLIPVSWTIFNITDLGDLFLYLKRMFFIPIEGTMLAGAETKFMALVDRYWWMLLICLVCCTPYPMKFIKRFYKNWACKVMLLILFWVCVAMLVQGADNPFLYFRF
ncbi:MAG: MBOAT family protein [Lachnospiraceae bacterium]|nr:MBOAT family protein [Candidatus Merdinaster equi]